MGIKMEVHTTGAVLDFPGKGFPVPVSKEIGEAVVSNSIDNVLQQRTTTGGRIKANAPSTRERKRAKGRRQLSLVDEFKRFLKRANYKITATRKQVSVELKNTTEGGGPGAKDLSIILQKKGYGPWLGLTRKGVLAVKLVIADWIDELIVKASKKRSRK